MSSQSHSCPMPQEQAIDTYFLEHRAKLLDVAAFMDRVQRCKPAAGGEDYRMAAFKRAVALLIDGQPERARRIQEVFSDPTTTPIDSAAGMKGAFGAYDGGAA